MLLLQGSTTAAREIGQENERTERLSRERYHVNDPLFVFIDQNLSSVTTKFRHFMFWWSVEEKLDLEPSSTCRRWSSVLSLDKF